MRHRFVQYIFTAILIAGLAQVASGNLLWSADHQDLPSVGTNATPWGDWATEGTLIPQVVEEESIQWAEVTWGTRNPWVYAPGGTAQTYSDPIPIDGATVVVALKYTYIPGLETKPHTSAVDVFFDQLCLGINASTGKVSVRADGTNWTSAGAPAAVGERGVLSLSVGNGGDFSVWWRGENASGAAVLVGTGTGAGGGSYTALTPNKNGNAATVFNSVRIGSGGAGSDPTQVGWIGDVYVYGNQLDTAEREALEMQVFTAMIPEPGTIGLLALFGVMIWIRRFGRSLAA